MGALWRDNSGAAAYTDCLGQSKNYNEILALNTSLASLQKLERKIIGTASDRYLTALGKKKQI